MKYYKEYKNHQPAKARRETRMLFRQMDADASKVGSPTWRASDKRRGNTRARVVIKYLYIL